MNGHSSGVAKAATRREWEEALRVVEGRLSLEPGDVDAAFNRGRLLWNLGRVEEAKSAFARVLAVSPTHFGAINNLGVLLQSTGHGKDARVCYAEAVLRHPDNHVGHVNLANSLVEDGEFELAVEHFQKALGMAPGLPVAHRGLAGVFEKLGREDAAEEHRRLGFRNQATTVFPFKGSGEPVAALLFASTRGNVPMHIPEFFDENIFQVTVIVPEFYGPERPLPPHRFIVNLVGNADICGHSLDAAERLLSLSAAPVVNHPAAVRATGRASVTRRLGQVPGVVAPLTADVPRALLAAPDGLDRLGARGFAVPFLLRTPGFSNGLHFLRIARPGDLARALAALPGDQLTAIQYLDARSADGKIRKYRAMLIDGEIFPVHAALSERWKIHFATADMVDSPLHRAEDEAFLQDMPGVVGPRAMAALAGIGEVLGLEYGGVDFSLNAEGELLLFEANATMNVSRPGPERIWDYRRAPVERVMDAAKGMFARRAGVGRASGDLPGLLRESSQAVR